MATREEAVSAGERKEETADLAAASGELEKGGFTAHAEADGLPSDSDEVNPAAEKRLLRKMDRTVLPLVTVLYLLAYLDRSNIGNARIAGMAVDLDLDSEKYDWLLTIFYIPYVVMQWQILMYKFLPAHIWAAFCTFAWGLMSTVQAAAQNWSGMMALRAFLAVHEAGFVTGVPFFLSFFYLRRELGVRQAVFVSASPLANTFAGALAYGITRSGGKFAKWRELFLVEGLPTLAMVPVVYFFLPDTPKDMRGLTDDERAAAKARLIRQVGHVERVGGLDSKDVLATFLDPVGWLLAVTFFCLNTSFGSLPVFLPTILNEMGFTAINAQGLTAPPYFLAFLVTISTTYLADRTQQRGVNVTILSLIGASGYVLLAVTKSVGARYAGVFLAASGISGTIGNIVPWTTNNQGSDTRRATVWVLYTLVGQCGPLLGTRLYPSQQGPDYRKGHTICASLMFAAALLSLVLRFVLAARNKKLDAQYGTLQELRARAERDGDGSADFAVEDYGPMFRYVL